MEVDTHVRLRIDKLQLNFGGVFALDKVSLDVRDISVPL
jgi:ABC-type branched-subunit amino acid transport system ATPase component